eukprot:TRINITY_DN12811_c0_g1_i1.p1 TRINITY_DN12811_c0_g1~~TRINITY_DN12811_c0_g1_i1.p1  ORF type:complete len:132 (-),score=27.17 TRINITY_DN12811_c0_g1_i1:424-819(-)
MSSTPSSHSSTLHLAVSPVKTKRPKQKELPEVLDHRKLFKEGQKYMCPPVADATRAFYESLLEENPESIIAIRYCVENGVMPLDKHKSLLKKYNRLKEKGAFSVAAKLKRSIDKRTEKLNRMLRDIKGKNS